MYNYTYIRGRIREIEQDTPKGRSNVKHLLLIIDKAAEWEIDPALIENAKISNLRDLIKEARLAIDFNDKPRLEELFSWASTYSNGVLRMKLRPYNIRNITVRRGINGLENRILVNDQQLQRMIMMTRRSFTYIMEG